MQPECNSAFQAA